MAAEKNFEDRVKAFLKEQGCYFIKYWGGGRYTRDGVPDLLVCMFGSFVGIEIKAQHGEPSMLQLKHLDMIRDAGGFGILLYPRDFENFMEWAVDKFRKHKWYMKNLELQKQWFHKILERVEKDGN